jgi:putative peptide maturation dehydrogenase
VTDAPEEPFPELRLRDEQLREGQWEPAAALHHFSTKLHGADLELPEDEDERFEEVAAEADRVAAEFVERHGKPPGHFHSHGQKFLELPLIHPEGGLYEALAARRTTRGFERGRPISLDRLSVLLYEVFGCRGFASVHPALTVLRKGSPSGGGLHPLEAYPLVQAVDGVEPGVYHYAVRDHALELVVGLQAAGVRHLVTAFTCGQVFFASAPVAIALTARFPRSFWKYRRHPKAYATLLLDAGHLSQSFYLVCADLGLGAFFTNVVNGSEIEERLGLDGLDEGAIGMLGCGFPASGGSLLDPEFTAYVPRETAL